MAAKKHPKNRPITVISLGGSIIVPDDVDTSFLKGFAALIKKRVAKGEKFVIIAGGGKTARRYQESARAVSTLDKEDIDWLGIHATRLNGHLIRTVFRKEAARHVVKDPTRKVSMSKPILVAAGWKPGWSTDYVAVRLAKNIGAKRLVNLSNIDYVFTKDPKKFNDATPIEHTNWNEFRKLLPPKWDPGLSSPFDPVAAKEAQKLGLEVAILNGRKLDEIENYLNGKKFKGTVIS